MKKIKIQFMCVLFSLLLTACADTVQEKNTSKDVTQEYLKDIKHPSKKSRFEDLMK